jgi:hypothetical protein
MSRRRNAYRLLVGRSLGNFIWKKDTDVSGQYSNSEFSDRLPLAEEGNGRTVSVEFRSQSEVNPCDVWRPKRHRPVFSRLLQFSSDILDSYSSSETYSNHWFSPHKPTICSLDGATMKRIYGLWGGPTRLEERLFLPQKKTSSYVISCLKEVSPHMLVMPCRPLCNMNFVCYSLR